MWKGVLMDAGLSGDSAAEADGASKGSSPAE